MLRPPFFFLGLIEGLGTMRVLVEHGNSCFLEGCAFPEHIWIMLLT